MDETQFTGMEVYATVGVTSVESVFQVAFYGATDSRELAANLVMSACVELDFQQVEIV